MRKEVRVIGIDDGPFFKFRKGRTLVVGTIFRGGKFMDGLVTTTAKVDGSDGTKNIAKMINKSKFKTQIRCIMLDGVSVGGFNVIDLPRLNKLTKIPVIAVIRRNPDVPYILKTLRNLGMERKARVIEQLPKPTKVGKVYIQYIDCTLAKAKEFMKITTTYAYIPEPIRIAHIIAAGIIKGESRGRA